MVEHRMVGGKIRYKEKGDLGLYHNGLCVLGGGVWGFIF